MLQERELIPFLHQLLAVDCESRSESRYELLMETSGERPLELVPREVHKIVDVKCPGSGEHLRFRPENLATLTARDELKFVLASREDYEYARDFIREHGLDSNPAGLILSPAFRKGQPARAPPKIACSIRATLPSGCWPTTSTPASASRSTNSSGSRNSRAYSIDVLHVCA